MITYNEAKKILFNYGQEHILRYFDELSEENKAALLRQIELTDFSVLDDFRFRNDAAIQRGTFAPLGAVTVYDI